MTLTAVVPDPSIGQLVTESHGLFDQTMVRLPTQLVSTEHSPEVPNGRFEQRDAV